jgi:hypothetical protein
VIYLYGDLSIYITVVSKSLRDVICANGTDLDPCLAITPNLDRSGAYRLAALAFTSLIGPLALFNVSKTKYVQISTTVARWAGETQITLLNCFVM